MTPEAPDGLDTPFVAQRYRALSDAADRKVRIAELVATAIIPRLGKLPAALPDVSGAEDVAELVRQVLGPDERDAISHVERLKARGLPAETLFTGLLQPAARLLGELWTRDEADFCDVTIGVARLQALLAYLSDTHGLAAANDMRSVLMLTMPGEQHSFGVAMVERFLEAGGWQVCSEREVQSETLARLVRQQWFAVVGIGLSNGRDLNEVIAAIETVRASSRNRKIGIIVGGPDCAADPDLAARLGADGTADSGPTAVVLAQKLLDAALTADAGHRPEPKR